jgi:hypothetical protein
MLACRLKEILPEVISPMQCPFVPRRLIMDNVLMAYESIHAIKIRDLVLMVRVLLNLICTRHMIEWSGCF